MPTTITFKVLVAKAGGIDAIAAAICNHAGASTVVTQARRALERLDITRLTASAGSLDALISALGAHAAAASRPVTAAQAAECLARLAPTWVNPAPDKVSLYSCHASHLPQHPSVALLRVPSAAAPAAAAQRLEDARELAGRAGRALPDHPDVRTSLPPC